MVEQSAIRVGLADVVRVVSVGAMSVALACVPDAGGITFCQWRENAETREFLRSSRDRQREFLQRQPLDTQLSLYLAEMRCGKAPRNGVLVEDLASLGDSAIPIIVQRAEREQQKYLKYHLLQILGTMACRGRSVGAKYPEAIRAAETLASSTIDDGRIRSRELYNDLKTDCARKVIRPPG